jgi:uncharacterized protein (TIGR00725 family)
MRIPIIGVIGGTTEAKEGTLKLASRLGHAIAKSGCILLTGGEAIEAEESVKAQAMAAALKAATSNRRVGVIGLIPDTKAPVIRFDVHENISPGFRLYLNTGVSSHERNVLTGSLPDALIALRGKGGTLSEVAYALNASRPIVFLNSWYHLRSALKTERENVKAIVRESGEFSASSLVQSLDQLFLLNEDAPIVTVSYAVLDNPDSTVLDSTDSTPEKAVQIAMVLGRSTLESSPYPHLEKSSLRNLKTAFEPALEKLEQCIGSAPQEPELF